jgi:[acyl-carrier-protein] S-malonyltransferase
MQPAQDRLALLLRQLPFAPASVPVVVNVDAKLAADAETLRDALVRQVTGTVRWVESMQALIAERPDCYLEVGPGKVLAGLLRQIDREQKCAQVQDEATLGLALEMAGGKESD